MCVKTLIQLLSIYPQKRLIHMLVFVVYLLVLLSFSYGFYEEPSFLFVSENNISRHHLVPLVLKVPWSAGNVVVILLLVSTDRHRHFSEEEKGPFQVWSQPWLCPDCITGCAQTVVSGTCIYQLGFGRRKKSSYHEYPQLPPETYMHNILHPYSTFTSL